MQLHSPVRHSDHRPARLRPQVKSGHDIIREKQQTLATGGAHKRVKTGMNAVGAIKLKKIVRPISHKEKRSAGHCCLSNDMYLWFVLSAKQIGHKFANGHGNFGISKTVRLIIGYFRHCAECFVDWSLRMSI